MLQSPPPNGSKRAVELRQLGRAVPIHFIGDSHTIIHHDMLYSSAPGNVGPSVVRTSWCPGVSAATFTSPEGVLDRKILGSLLTSLALFGDESDWGKAGRDAVWAEFTHRLTRARDRWGPDLEVGFLNPVVVFCIGSADMWAILKSLGPTGDFAYESRRLPRIAHDTGALRQTFPASLVRAMIDRALEPLFRGLRMLQDAGIDDIFLHGLEPPTLETGGDYLQKIGDAPIGLRYKVANAVNDRMVELCGESGIAFLDIWDQVVGADGLVDDAFVFDYAHLNQRAALLTMQELYEALAARRGLRP